ncbi:hypothetical protein YYG_03291 [Plasmodium vinckei petteri]|uniref:PIR protein CIR protein n=1 Tax=Plasmodium vinckei petteri TaxID=138298 RepID=W7B0F5_PLAVN|nr:hypothetical protein YYG_03291 [Plasmodium vinckei petteri]
MNFITCNLFLNADKFFNKNNIVDKKIFNSKYSSYKQYCLNKNCDSNRRRIAALSRYLFMELKIQNKEENYIYFLMWLSDKLFKIHNKGKENDNSITLNSAYDKYFKNNVENVNFWNALYNIRGLKNADLKHMSEFYKLLNHICKTITHYKTKGVGSKALLQYPAINESRKTYPNLFNRLQILTTKENIDNYFANGPKSFDFSNPKCQLRYDDNIFETLEKAKTQEKQKDNGSKGEDITLSTQPQSSVDQTSNHPTETGDSQSMLNNGTDTSRSKDDIVDNTKIEENRKMGEEKDPGGDTGNQKGTNQGNGSEGSNDGAGGTDNGSSNTDGVQGDQGNTGDSQGAMNSVPGASFDIEPYISMVASKGKEQLNNAFEFFKTKKKKIAEATDNIKNLYSTTLTNLETAYDKFSSFLKEIIDNISTLQSSQDPSGNKHSDQTDQGGPKKSVPALVTKQENSGTEIKGNETPGIGDIYVLKKYKKLGTSIIVLLIPITLAILYKKGIEEKKNMKKVINSIGGKRQMQIIISSSNQKKQTKKSINSVNEKNSRLYRVINLVNLYLKSNLKYV